MFESTKLVVVYCGTLENNTISPNLQSLKDLLWSRGGGRCVGHAEAVVEETHRDLGEMRAGSKNLQGIR